MDFMDLVCPMLRTPIVERFMVAAGYFGHGAVGSAVGLLFLAHGYAQDNYCTRRAGMALLVALIAAGITTELLKHIAQLPRPYSRASYGFPSGHTSTAFTLASVLTVTFPTLGPVFWILADLTALSRLYFRSNFTWDVAGGAIVGLFAGIPVARKMLAYSPSLGFGKLRLLGWLGAISLASGGLVYFSFVEKSIRLHLVSSTLGNSAPAIATWDFGTTAARPYLRYGWSMDEHWLGDKQSVIWAQGRASAVVMELPAAQDYRFRLRVLPYAPKATACQRIEVKINNAVVAKLLLERGWHSYEFNAPKTAIRAGKNDVQFFYDYAESPKSRERSADERDLSVAFDKLEVFAAQ